ncbi:hypothetical protein QIS99_09955 [Streptomyces sp. B-S-A8]|uniref:Uncharacterized protein n=1 Tax=Streptomyces solicavernae TaxID=3043614 RepID=A0ABT6RQ37_9ACTN|nr:hypothetical protein [Streptomyces sp. B-S-A8]MDI3386533.1 hypothetical protein [Streptomyces sp. B-S-A8]
MRALLARALSWAPWRRRPGRHSAKHLAAQRAAEPVPEPVSPWSRPWTSPSGADVRAIFRDPQTLALPTPQRERAWAAAFAELGVDYDHPAEPLASLVSPVRAAA